MPTSLLSACARRPRCRSEPAESRLRCPSSRPRVGASPARRTSLRIRILCANGTSLEGRSEDISVGGLLVLAPQAFGQEESVSVRFALPITGKLLEVPATARWVKKARGTGAIGP
ncbi:MAG: PilZ domain-containing protein [Pseudomonadota bacterium]